MKVSLVILLLISAVLSAHLAQSTVHTTLDEFRNEELKKHNQYRSLHGCPALVLSESLNKVAQAYAEKIANAHTFTHSPAAKSGAYGENLYWVWGYPTLTYKLGDASNSWYSEVQYYDYTTSKSSTVGKPVGHFTAMIWKKSKQIGLGYAKVNQTKNGRAGQAVYIVANYAPTPNVAGQYKENVPPKLK